MHEFRSKHSNEDGSTIVLVLIVLALMTVIGISAVNRSTTEQNISVNDKDYKIVFYHSESGNYAMTKWVTRVINDKEVPPQEKTVEGELKDIHRFELGDGETEEALKEEVYYDDGDDDTDDGTEDLIFNMESGIKDEEDGTVNAATSNVTIDIDKKKTQQVVGGGAEFGKGTGSQGTIEIPYWFTTEAIGPKGERASIMSKYLKLPDIPGGL